MECSCFYQNQYIMVCLHIMKAINIYHVWTWLIMQIFLSCSELLSKFYFRLYYCWKVAWHKFQNNSSEDPYIIAREVDDNVIIEQPPSYKTVTLSEQKRRYQSEDDMVPGKYQKCTNTEKRKIYTPNTLSTKVKYYTDNESKLYTSLANNWDFF